MRLLTVTTIALALAFAAGVALASAPAAGSWKTSGGISFAFTLKKGSCYLPPKNLKNPKAKRGKLGRGLCFASTSEPPIHLTCGGGATISGTTFGVVEFSGLRIPPSGTLHLKTYSYTGDGTPPVGDSELDLKLSGSKASGYLRQTTTVYPNGTAATCDSGKVAFTAKRK